MSVKLNTLGDMLLKRYVTDFVANMQKISPFGAAMWNSIEEDTDFGKLLHKEGLWSLYQFKEEKSLLYHLCRQTYGRMELVNYPCDPESSMCSSCTAEAPDEIRGIWTLHNFDWIQENGANHV